MTRIALFASLFLLTCSAPAPVQDAGQPDTDGGTDAGTDGGSDGGADAGLSDETRLAALTQTLTSNPACSTTNLPEGFYWEIGDRDGMRASGTVSGTNTPTRTQVIAIASASKWIYSTYVLEKVGSLRTSDVPFLNFTSGKLFPPADSKETNCGLQTVGECAAAVVDSSIAMGRFAYGAGHFQFHAANVMGLAALNAGALTAEMRSVLGANDLTYLQTNLAGGANTSAAEYAALLSRMLRDELVMSSLLGSNKVCASSACAAGMVLSPAPPDEQWSYSLGHWVEDDPIVGDHAFSSAGALGFYPWIDESRAWYGVLARRASSPGGNQGVASLRCGRLLRKAWISGVAVP